MSVRDSACANPVVQWATTWLDVPFIYGSVREWVEHYEGADCADLLIGAHNKAHPWHSFGYTNANGLAHSEAMTEPGVQGTEGDLIFWDYHGDNETGPPDGKYDHSMICTGGTAAIWASAGWGSDGVLRRCVKRDDWEAWQAMIENESSWAPVTAACLWRRFR
ncbi:MAG: hypothetical protein COY42_34295 [Armatimonadetes bacterium CG_4_10_14_0_8_um_filter_66_14]|nr:hypothetical protein [Armatimonadota bacterium]PIX40488.1 MAG: hypothetical protein COZ57_25825 [Armatimonadetes bacterium CG_4_8_14_3_um_filter_66_20]PIZ30243.1 MAG: hypothetical protein COY42_34295 [Armatimonadetes bacterium CG_4_10_14_0_8_um_filter_66_14]PJB61440.1 MAG: hypothetical protein CO096_28815 [Armatimonadetes bacterium CG_4_9_14_3_um_filter_66_14]NCP34728.1 hypothetical protein [Armatimonadota bacterium]